MAKSRHYGVRYAFPAKSKEGNTVRITPVKAELIEDLLTPAQIKAHLEAGNLIDNGAASDDAATPKGAK